MRRTRWIVGGIAWAAVAVVGVVLALRSRAPSDSPERLMPIAPFELVDHDGAPFGSDALRGKVWIAGFAFTSCTTICPMLTSQMANVQRRTAHHGDRVHLVTITVDPVTDTPARLREYGARHHADLSRWSFLTGDPARVRATIEGSFRRAVGVRRDLGEGYDVLHSGDLMLIDGEGVLRGIYRTDAEDLDRLAADVDRLVAE